MLFIVILDFVTIYIAKIVKIYILANPKRINVPYCKVVNTLAELIILYLCVAVQAAQQVVYTKIGE